jgi:hypothetical protein
VNSLGSFSYRFISSTNIDELTSSFHDCFCFISFSLLIALVRTLYWIGVDTLVLFLTLEEMPSVFPCLV